ncbi:hypothetical protein QFZ77_005837 [Paenibacillus sp. V4I3]|uniref:CBO0543 family protein n=1 Tax=unclassified Paenibacillus TaxID=185978 RepID=UPI0027829B37|nr:MULTISPECIES: CBO0543 family protein [unclassified Paenibacillus]MDQ0877178.1 hypothetical protein [Paenibacillus sp. V4I3]MDQ0886943.1 hypothetical protein [Paenibacillus sp. V4I9]
MSVLREGILTLVGKRYEDEGGSVIMILERKIIILVWILGLAMVILFVQRSNARRFILAYFTSQAIVWFSVILLIKLRIISFPVREFPRATDIGFTMTYVLYPILCGIYIILEPRRSRAINTLYLLLWCAALALLNDMLAKYTQLLDYKFLDWFMGSMFFIFLLVLTNMIVRWFYRNGEPEATEAELEEVNHEHG